MDTYCFCFSSCVGVSYSRRIGMPMALLTSRSLCMPSLAGWIWMKRMTEGGGRSGGEGMCVFRMSEQWSVTTPEERDEWVYWRGINQHDQINGIVRQYVAEYSSQVKMILLRKQSWDSLWFTHDRYDLLESDIRHVLCKNV